MRSPWKYRKVPAREFDRLHQEYERRARNISEFHTRYYCSSLGGNWYGLGVGILRDVPKNPWHWTRGKHCGYLKPGKHIVDCLCGIRNGRGNLSWMVGRHYVGMCPFKNKWRMKLKLKSMAGMKGRG